MIWNDSGYCPCSPLDAMKAPQLLTSLTTRACRPGAGAYSGEMSSDFSRSLSSGSCKAAWITFCSFVVTSFGKPFGPNTANQNRRSTSACLMPTSSSVGTRDRAGERVLPVTARHLIRLVSTRGFATWLDGKVRSTCPAIRSAMAGPLGRYGTSIASILAPSRTTSQTSCDTDVTPADANVNFFDDDWESAISSFMSLAGTALATHIASGEVAANAIGVNSVLGSNCGLMSLKPGRITSAFSAIISV